ncbi:hypothetical protein ACFU5Y_18840 [Streptomyces gardneri]
MGVGSGERPALTGVFFKGAADRFNGGLLALCEFGEDLLGGVGVNA